jgi:hypothetical protein
MVNLDRFASGQDGIPTTPLRIACADLGTAWQEVTGTFTIPADWPYTYAFCGFSNDLRTSAGEPVAARLDGLSLSLTQGIRTEPPTSGPLVLEVAHAGGTATTDEMHALIERARATLPLGRYEVAVTMRWTGPTEGERALANVIDQRFSLFAVGEGAGGQTGGALRGGAAMLPSSLRPGQSETIRFPIEVVYPDADIPFAIRHDNTTLPAVSIERIAFTRLERGSEMAAVQRLQLPEPIATLIPKPGLQVWRLDGLTARRLGSDGVCATLKAETTLSWLRMQQANPILAGQVPQRWAVAGGDATAANAAPATPGERPADAGPAWVNPVFEDRLMAHDVVVIHDLPIRCLSLAQRQALVAFVQAGGGLLISGGMYGLDRGGWQDSDLIGSILPVTLPEDATLDRIAKPAAVTVATSAKALAGATLTGSAQFRSTATPKPGAAVELTAGGQPMLVTGTVGKGRVAVLLTPPLGDHQDMYSSAKDWPDVYGRLLAWLATQ